MQSVIIKCTYNTQIAINVFAACTAVIHINHLTITHCSNVILIDSVSDAQMYNFSIQNSSEFCLWISNTTVTIDSFIFQYNRINGKIEFS